MTNETLKIEGMSCGHCVRAVTEALREIEGVDVQRVEIGKAEIAYPATVTRERVVAALEDAGYGVIEN